MSRLSKILWLICGVLLVSFMAVRFMLGYWPPFILYALIVPILLFIVAIVIDFKTYVEFFTMRTTKHGLNMGTMILLTFALIVALNVISVFNDKTWDLTKEKLHSLEKLSKDVLKTLEGDLGIKVFYNGSREKNQAVQLKRSLRLYSEASSRVKLQLIDAYVENVLAREYFQNLRSKDPVSIFVDYQKNRVRVETPSGQGRLEEKVTNAIIKVTRTSKKAIYILRGHGERETTLSSPTGGFPAPPQGGDEAQNLEGIHAFKKALEDSSFIVKDLNLLESGSIPDDLDLLVIAGPRSPLFQNEIPDLKKYALKGGRFLIAIDPGEKHEMSSFLKFLGVDFKDNYIINDVAILFGRGRASVLGVTYSPTSQVTKDLAKMRGFYTTFDFASEVMPVPKIEMSIKDFSSENLIQSHHQSYALKSLTMKKGEKQKKKRKPYTLSLSIKGKLSPTSLKEPLSSESSQSFDDIKKTKDITADVKDISASDVKEFKAIVFGDSDFLAGKNFFSANRDVALNSVSYLLDEGDLVSIRPKRVKTTPFQITSLRFNTVVLSGLFLPVLLFCFSVWFWYRRRNA